MIIKELAAALKESSAPVVKVLTAGPGIKVVVVGLKQGSSLKEHKTAIRTRLVVMTGEVIYRSGDGFMNLHQLDDLNIPVNEPHSLEAQTDSICLLIQG